MGVDRRSLESGRGVAAGSHRSASVLVAFCEVDVWRDTLPPMPWGRGASSPLRMGGNRRRPLRGVLTLLVLPALIAVVLLTSGTPAAAAQTTRPGASVTRIDGGNAIAAGVLAGVVAHTPLVGSSIGVARGVVVATGSMRTRSRSARPPATWRACLEEEAAQPKSPGEWVSRGCSRLKPRGAGFTYRINAPAGPAGVAAGTATFRVVVFAGRREAATSATRTIRLGAPVVVHSRLRATTEKLQPASIEKVTGDPKTSQTIVLRPGTTTPRVGAYVVAPASPTDPGGVLAVVTALTTLPGGAHELTTKPGTLDGAYSAFSANVAGTLGELAGDATTAQAAASMSGVHGATARAAVALSTLNAPFHCSDPATQLSVTQHVDLSELHVEAEVNIPAPSNGFYGPSILLNISGQPKLDFSVAFSGYVQCRAEAKLKIPLADTGVFLEIGPDFTLNADGKVSATMKWEPWLDYGFARGRGEPSNDWRSFHNDGTTMFSGGADLELDLGLAAALTLGGDVGLEGVAGPVIQGEFVATSASGAGCLTVDAAVHAELEAFAHVFFADYSFQIGAVTFGRFQLYHGCISQGGTGPGGGGGGSGSGSGGSGGSGGGGTGSGGGGEPEPVSKCKTAAPTPTAISLATNYHATSFPLEGGTALECGTVAVGLAGNRLFLEEPRLQMNGDEPEETYESAYEDLSTGAVTKMPCCLNAVSDNGEYAGSERSVYNINDPADTWTAPFPAEIKTGTMSSELAAISDNGDTAVFWVQGSKSEAEGGTFLYVAHRGDPTPELLSEGPKPWSFGASISGDGRYIVWHDDGGSDEYPRILDTTTGERKNLDTGDPEKARDESPIISEDGERIILVDFFGEARLEQRSTDTVASITQPLIGLNTELTYLLTYSGNYDCPSSINRYDVATTAEEPVLLAAASECSMTRGPGFGAPTLLVANSGEQFVWNTPERLLPADTNERVDAYTVTRTAP